MAGIRVTAAGNGGFPRPLLRSRAQRGSGRPHPSGCRPDARSTGRSTTPGPPMISTGAGRMHREAPASRARPSAPRGRRRGAEPAHGVGQGVRGGRAPSRWRGCPARPGRPAGRAGAGRASPRARWPAAPGCRCGRARARLRAGRVRRPRPPEKVCSISTPESTRLPATADRGHDRADQLLPRPDRALGAQRRVEDPLARGRVQGHRRAGQALGGRRWRIRGKREHPAATGRARTSGLRQRRRRMCSPSVARQDQGSVCGVALGRPRRPPRGCRTRAPRSARRRRRGPPGTVAATDEGSVSGATGTTSASAGIEWVGLRAWPVAPQQRREGPGSVR